MARQTRHTKQKAMIADAVQEFKSFFSAEDLHARVLQHDSRIGIATVYRFLQEAQKKGDLHGYTCERKMIYSRGKKSHCHFTCEKTGKVVHFDIENIDFLKKKIPGTITSFQIEVTGVCSDCSS